MDLHNVYYSCPLSNFHFILKEYRYYLMNDNFPPLSHLPNTYVSMFLPKASLIKFSSSSSSAASNKGENAYLTTKEVAENKSSLTGNIRTI